MNKQKFLALFFAVLMMFSSVATVNAEKVINKNPKSSVTETDKKNDEVEEDTFPDLHTDYYMLADLDTGRVLYAENPDAKVFPASTTKILTGIMVLENCVLTDVVTATREAIEPIDIYNQSNMGILIGEQLTVEQLLYGLMVHSANDAANVLGIHIAGSLPAFVDMMNARAKELGAENTNFLNAHGVHDENHYTSVADLAKITSYAMKNAKFAEIVSQTKYQMPPTNKYLKIRYFSSTNMLLSNNRTREHLFKYALGVKTGSTAEAGNCLVAAAEKNGTRLMTVVMKCENNGVGEGAYSYTDTRALFDYGFEHYKHITVAGLADVVADSRVREAKNGIRVTLSPETELKVLLPKTIDLDSIEADITKNKDIKAPVKKGDLLGTATYTLDGETLGTINLVAGNDVERDLLLHIFFMIWDFITHPIVILVILAILFLAASLKRRRSRRRKSRRRNLRRFQDND